MTLTVRHVLHFVTIEQWNNLLVCYLIPFVLVADGHPLWWWAREATHYGHFPSMHCQGSSNFARFFVFCTFLSVYMYYVFFVWAASYNGLMPPLAACHCNSWYVLSMLCTWQINSVSLRQNNINITAAVYWALLDHWLSGQCWIPGEGRGRELVYLDTHKCALSSLIAEATMIVHPMQVTVIGAGGC